MEQWDLGPLVGSSRRIITPGDEPFQARVVAHVFDRKDDYPILAALDLLEAAALQEAAEAHWANCEDCEGSASPELGCETAFKMADDARVMRRAAIAKATGKVLPDKAAPVAWRG